MDKKLLVVAAIPAFNEEKTIARFVLLARESALRELLLPLMIVGHVGRGLFENLYSVDSVSLFW